MIAQVRDPFGKRARRCVEAAADPDWWLETFERFEDEAIALELAADCGVEFDPEDLL